MKYSYHTKSSLFLTEIVINIFFFFLLLSFSMQFFAMANTRKIKNQDLGNAVRSCENAADIFESGDGSLASLQKAYPEAVAGAEGQTIAGSDLSSLTVYFDASGAVCPAGEAVYEMNISLEETDFARDHAGYASATIDYCKCGGDSVFTVTAHHYTPLTASDSKGGADHAQ